MNSYLIVKEFFRKSMVYTSEYFFEICKVALTYIYLRDDLREQKVFWLSFFYLDFCFSKMSRSQSFADTTTMITVVQAISDQIRLFRLVLKFFEVFFLRLKSNLFSNISKISLLNKIMLRSQNSAQISNL